MRRSLRDADHKFLNYSAAALENLPAPPFCIHEPEENPSRRDPVGVDCALTPAPTAAEGTNSTADPPKRRLSMRRYLVLALPVALLAACDRGTPLPPEPLTDTGLALPRSSRAKDSLIIVKDSLLAERLR